MSPILKPSCLKFSFLSLFLLFFQPVFSQQSAATLDDWLQQNLKDLGGRAVLMIWKDGKVIYSKALNNMTGKQKLAGRWIARKKGLDSQQVLENFTTTTRQRIASCSKWLSAALVMTFVDEGQLKLEDTVGTFLPVMTAHGKGNITIGQCLSHLTGIQAESLRESLENINKTQSMEEAINNIANLPMEGEPGKTFHYSNVGLQIAGAVIEKIAHKDFETLFAERIAKPLGLTNTDFGNKKVPLPAGGAWSTPEDYLTFLQMILNEGVYNGKRILSKASIVAMQQNYLTPDTRIVYRPDEAGNMGYGLGEWIMDDAQGKTRSKVVSSPGLFGSFPWVNYEKNYCAFLFTMNIKNKGRNEKYNNLKSLVDEWVSKN